MALRSFVFSAVTASRKFRIDQTSVTTNTSTIVPTAVSVERMAFRRTFFRMSIRNFTGCSLRCAVSGHGFVRIEQVTIWRLVDEAPLVEEQHAVSLAGGTGV